MSRVPKSTISVGEMFEAVISGAALATLFVGLPLQLMYAPTVEDICPPSPCPPCPSCPFT